MGPHWRPIRGLPVGFVSESMHLKSGNDCERVLLPGERFVVDVAEVVVVHLHDDATKLVVEWWTLDGGRQIVARA